MKERLFQMLVSALIELLDEEMLRTFVDIVLDWAEDAARDSTTTVDDRIVLPLCGTIRRVFGIPDND